MTTKQWIKQLKDRDPEKRKAAIKALARAKSRDALVPLAKMAGDDRDKDIRKLAQKAGAFILHETGGLPAKKGDTNPLAPPPLRLDKKGQPIKVVVDEASERRAAALINEALTANTAGDPGRAMQILARALSMNPNLRSDPYFISVAEAATGRDGEEAIEHLFDDSAREKASQKQAAKLRKDAYAEHLETTSRATWADVAFDMGLLAVALAAVLIIASFIIVQSADGYVNRVNQNRLDVVEARRAGRVVADEESSNFGKYFKAELNADGNPIYFEEMEPDANFLATAQDIASIDALTIFAIGLGGGLAAAFLTFTAAGIMHGTARSVLRGTGSFRYLVHRVASLLASRTVIYGVLASAGGAAVFFMGGGIATTIVGGALALFTLTVVYKLVTTVGQAYHFGPVKGMVATIAGLTVFALAGGMGFMTM